MSRREAIICGIDEAGLGPLLGPLTIGYATLSLPDPHANPWRLLRGLVGQRASQAKRIVVADSKRVFARNARGRARLEATALCFLALLDERGKPPSDARDLLFGTQLAPAPRMVALHPWYEHLPARLPLEHEPAWVELSAEFLRRRMKLMGLELKDAGVRVVPAGELNASYDKTHNKSVSVWEMMLEVLQHLWRTQGAASPRVVVDRQGGRMRYGPQLARGFPEAAVTLLHEDERCSEYRLVDRAGGRAMQVQIVEKAEDKSFPVALASCLAKYARELAMGAFNTYFGDLQPGLNPTAGYTLDGRRWLEEARPALDRASLPRQVLVRER